jgi:hypothetical protein
LKDRVKNFIDHTPSISLFNVDEMIFYIAIP